MHKIGLIAAQALGIDSVSAQTTLLNISNAPVRELHKDFNAAFAKHWRAKTGQTLNIRQSHGGSGKQALSVRDGLEADVVTLAQGYNMDELAQKTHFANGATFDQIYSKK